MDSNGIYTGYQVIGTNPATTEEEDIYNRLTEEEKYPELFECQWCSAEIPEHQTKSARVGRNFYRVCPACKIEIDAENQLKKEAACSK
jgi:hypothetical protein